MAAVVLALALVGATAATGQAAVVSKHTGQDRAEVARYWTAKRMQEAVPADRGLSRAHPAAKPGGGTRPGSSFEAPQPYDSMHGKVFFTDSGVNYVCSGSAIASVNESVVWTAGHCVNEGPGDFYTNFLFVPAYRNGSEPYGRFAATELMTTSGWQNSGNFGVDLGAAVVSTNAGGQSLNEAASGRSLVFNSTRNQSYQLIGYPAAGKFNGQRMRICDTQWALNDTTSPQTMGVRCDMTGGSSGGGWVTTGGQVASVISYYYPSLKGYLFGPHQETAAQQLFSAAEAP